MQLPENMCRERSLSGSEIARELDISRQAVSQLLKKGLTKLYYGISKRGISSSPFETASMIIDFLGIEDPADAEEFFDLLPQHIQKEIKDDAPKLQSKK